MRWRTHHRRAARQEHDVQDRISAACAAFLEQIKPRLIEGLIKAAVLECAVTYAASIGVRFTQDRRLELVSVIDSALAKARQFNEWPDVVLEDILDAEFIGE